MFNLAQSVIACEGDCVCNVVSEMPSDGDSLSLEDALGAIQPMSPDNSDVVNAPPTV